MDVIGLLVGCPFYFASNVNKLVSKAFCGASVHTLPGSLQKNGKDTGQNKRSKNFFVCILIK